MSRRKRRKRRPSSPAARGICAVGAVGGAMDAAVAAGRGAAVARAEVGVEVEHRVNTAAATAAAEACDRTDATDVNRAAERAGCGANSEWTARAVSVSGER